jgi:hypothetical protein
LRWPFGAGNDDDGEQFQPLLPHVVTSPSAGSLTVISARVVVEMPLALRGCIAGEGHQAKNFHFAPPIILFRALKKNAT